MRVKDGLNLWIFLLGIIVNVFNGKVIEGLLAFAVVLVSIFSVSVLLTFFEKRFFIGGGDVKLFMALSVWLNVSDVPIFLILSGGFGIMLAFFYRRKIFPFAPAIFIGGFLAIILGAINNDDLYANNLKKGNIMTEKHFSSAYIKAKQPVKKIIMIMHGYGADSNDLLPLAQDIADATPDADIFVPDGFDVCEGANPTYQTGRQWFSLKGWGSDDAWKSGIKEATQRLSRHIDLLLKKYNIDDKKLYLVGFSQGAMMALHVGIQRNVGGIVAFSGILVDEQVLQGVKKSDVLPKIILAHGDIDQVVPVSFCERAEKVLKDKNFDVKKIITQGMGHSISSSTIRFVCDFFKQQ